MLNEVPLPRRFSTRKRNFVQHDSAFIEKTRFLLRFTRASPEGIISFERRCAMSVAETTVVQPAIETRLRMSYEEYKHWEHEGGLTEWIDGEVHIYMPPED